MIEAPYRTSRSRGLNVVFIHPYVNVLVVVNVWFSGPSDAA